jgi:hypothetical protein
MDNKIANKLNNNERINEHINKLLSELNSKIDILIELNDIKNMKSIKTSLQYAYDKIKNKMDIIIETDNIIEIIHKNIKKQYLSELYDDNGKINIKCTECDKKNVDDYDYDDSDSCNVRDNYKSVKYIMELEHDNIVEIYCYYSFLPHSVSECTISISNDESSDFYKVNINIHDKFKINKHDHKALSEIFKFKKIDVLKFVELFYINMQHNYSN